MKVRYVFAIIASIVVIVGCGLHTTKEGITIAQVIATNGVAMVMLSLAWLAMGNLTGSGTHSLPDMELNKGEVFKVIGVAELGGATFALVTRYPFSVGADHENIIILRFTPKHLEQGPSLNVGYKYIWNGEGHVSIMS